MQQLLPRLGNSAATISSVANIMRQYVFYFLCLLKATYTFGPSITLGRRGMTPTKFRLVQTNVTDLIRMSCQWASPRLRSYDQDSRVTVNRHAVQPWSDTQHLTIMGKRIVISNMCTKESLLLLIQLTWLHNCLYTALQPCGFYNSKWNCWAHVKITKHVGGNKKKKQTTRC